MGIAALVGHDQREGCGKTWCGSEPNILGRAWGCHVGEIGRRIMARDVRS